VTFANTSCTSGYDSLKAFSYAIFVCLCFIYRNRFHARWRRGGGWDPVRLCSVTKLSTFHIYRQHPTFPRSANFLPDTKRLHITEHRNFTSPRGLTNLYAVHNFGKWEGGGERSMIMDTVPRIIKRCTLNIRCASVYTQLVTACAYCVSNSCICAATDSS
jgi:hypothetical protein